jgi:predicted ester cyclase
MADSEANRALVRRMEEELFNNRNLATLDEFIAAEYVLRTASEGTPADREAVRESIAMYLGAFPDLRISIDELLAVGDKVIGRFTFTGTHEGELMGLAPTGRRIAVRQIAMYRIEGGKVVEEWEVSDQLGLMQQLGAIPGPA